MRPAWANSSGDSSPKNNQSKMDWRCDSSNKSTGSASAKLCVQTPVSPKIKINELLENKTEASRPKGYDEVHSIWKQMHLVM
jgi:hypothetical protein